MSLLRLHIINWSRNSVGGMQTGNDTADSFEEACEIAQARVRGGGIPATAKVTESASRKTCRTYIKDFDARVTYVDPLHPVMAEVLAPFFPSLAA
jgi:hypothetical protein